MPIPEAAITAAVWLVVADLIVVSALLGGYAARIARKWLRGDQ